MGASGIGLAQCFQCNSVNCIHTQSYHNEYYRQIHQLAALRQSVPQVFTTTSNSTGSIFVTNPNIIYVPATVKTEKKVDKRLLLL